MSVSVRCDNHFIRVMHTLSEDESVTNFCTPAETASHLLPNLQKDEFMTAWIQIVCVMGSIENEVVEPWQ